VKARKINDLGLDMIGRRPAMNNIIKKIKRSFEVIEDNGGGITLFVFDDSGKVEYAHTGYEYHVGQLTDDLKALAKGSNPAEDWDGAEEDPQRMYDQMISYKYGWKIVADNDGIYPEEMDEAAMLEFKVDIDI
jgi:hypothetical protein